MNKMHHVIRTLAASLLLLFYLISPQASANNAISIPILTYHNFDPSTSGSMTISTGKFENQIKWLKDNGYTIVPLKDVVSYLQGNNVDLPEKSVVITVDDGKDSVYKYMLPIVQKYNIPVTLFIYPSAISNASYAMTWDQLKTLQKIELFDIQSHTYWHPNFKQEKARLTPEEYQKFVDNQLSKSKKVLEEKLGIQVTLLAWPFGIYDEYLEEQAANAGYAAAFSVDPRPANRSEKMMSQPRYMISEGQTMKTFEKIAQGQKLKD